MYVAVIAFLIAGIVRRGRVEAANVVEDGRHHEEHPAMRTGLIGWGAVVATGLVALAVASFLTTCPSQSFHIVRTDDQGDSSVVSQILPVRDCGIWLNGGFFVFRQEIFDYIHDREELVIGGNLRRDLALLQSDIDG